MPIETRISASDKPISSLNPYLLNAFASVFIGASTLRPGVFHILGTMVGVLLIGVIDNGLSILGVATFWQYIVQGLLLISSLFASGVLKLRKGRRALRQDMGNAASRVCKNDAQSCLHDPQTPGSTTADFVSDRCAST
jgi:hypothetical protein